jgi:hypothetical protein
MWVTTWLISSFCTSPSMSPLTQVVIFPTFLSTWLGHILCPIRTTYVSLDSGISFLLPCLPSLRYILVLHVFSMFPLSQEYILFHFLSSLTQILYILCLTYKSLLTFVYSLSYLNVCLEAGILCLDNWFLLIQICSLSSSYTSLVLGLNSLSYVNISLDSGIFFVLLLSIHMSLLEYFCHTYISSLTQVYPLSY